MIEQHLIGKPPLVSVVIPALNAANTVEQTLDSVLAQTLKDWELIVVDDGSTDGTADIVARYAARDSRVRVLKGPHQGVSSTRNTGLMHAAGEFLMFLDADDWWAPETLELLVRELKTDKSLDAVHCGWTRVAPDGTLTGPGEPTQREKDLYPFFATTCVFAIHACMWRRSLLESAGGFDTTLKTCEDWDLWQRLARAGAKFGSITETLAFYRLRPGSASTAGTRMIGDGIKVITRAHDKDDRVIKPLAKYAKGLPKREIRSRLYEFCAYPAGLMIGSGDDATVILEQLKDVKSVGVSPVSIAFGILYGVPTPLCRPREEWPAMWPEMEGRINAFLNALEHASSTIGLAKRSRIALARLVAEIMLPSEAVAKEQAKRMSNAKRAPRAALRNALLGETFATSIELTDPLNDIQTPEGAERFFARVRYGGQDVGQVELPVFDDRISAATLADAIASQHAWNILGQYLQRTILTDAKFTDDPELGLIARRGNVRLAEGLWKEKPLQSLFDAAGWTVFLQELWGHADWPAWKFYDKSSLAFDDEDATTPTQLVLDGKSVQTIEVALPLPQLITRANATEAQVNVTIGGASIGLITVKLENGSATRSMIRMAITEQVGVELAIVAVREAVIGQSTDMRSLRDRLLAAKLRSDSTTANAGVLPRRSAPAACNSTARHADLPINVLEDVLSVRRAAGEPLPAQLPSDNGTIHYSPSLIAGAKLSPAVDSRPTQKTELRARESLVHARSGFIALPQLPRKLKNFAKRILGRPTTPPPLTNSRIDALPILMYHRVSPEGLDANARYRVTPKLFEEQLRCLRDAGYSTVSPVEWRTCVESRKPLATKSVLLTFDDGFVDFADFAWPLLKKYGMGATVFLVTDLVGKTNEWDAAAGESLPLMNWKTIRRLQREGCVFGSHTATHQPLTSLTPTDIVRQAARSRATMCRELNENIDTIAYPFGDTDAVVAHLFGAVGYTFGVTCERAQSGLKDSLLSLPRIEIEGADTIDQFKAKLAA